MKKSKGLFFVALERVVFGDNNQIADFSGVIKIFFQYRDDFIAITFESA